MQKIFNTILMVIFVSLVSLFVYKNFTKPAIVNVPVEEANSQKAAETNSTLSGMSKEEVQGIVKDYIMNHPQEIVDSVEKLHSKQAEESTKHTENFIQNNLESIEQNGNPPTFGSKNGDISVVMFYDYNCSYCKKANDYNLKLIASDPNVKVTLRPIAILGESSVYATKVAMAMYKILGDKFIDFHNELISTKPLLEENVKTLVRKHGVDYAMVENEMNSAMVKESFDKNMELAKNLEIRGAPSYVINGYYVSGLIDSGKFGQIISHIRSTKTEEQKPNEETKEINEEIKEGAKAEVKEELKEEVKAEVKKEAKK